MTDDTRSYAWYFAYAPDAECFTRCDSREEAIQQGEAEAREDGCESFFICEASHYELRDDFPIAEEACSAFVAHNQSAWGDDGPGIAVAPEALAELQQSLSDAFAAWRAKHTLWAPYMLEHFRNDEVIEVKPHD
jgi:hypothetical protein